MDLAGSERVSSTGSEGVRFKEGTYINLSLLGLGNVISKLSEGNWYVRVHIVCERATGTFTGQVIVDVVCSSHVPFRNSKLTRILQSSLGGNAKTAMLCSITPAEVSESHSTLKVHTHYIAVSNLRDWACLNFFPVCQSSHDSEEQAYSQ